MFWIYLVGKLIKRNWCLPPKLFGQKLEQLDYQKRKLIIIIIKVVLSYQYRYIYDDKKKQEGLE